ncbi:Arrestin domain-containing protein 3 [Mortierella polycephala]|uniref:Arrestin domain-containing protein 3 n=1 Tax=Mortierella polycephala TaxID=41804 RepID=A0A9P6QIA6_9FUNG|nr:Arrestin domain-containing protein 3 [Mortierella polycephala]
MAPGESIRGQIHLELPKATPVHSIEVCLTGTVTALDGTRLGSMKTVTILEECKTVATASITNARANTTRRHTTPAPTTTSIVSAASTTYPQEEISRRGRGRRGSVTNVSATQDRTRSSAIPIQNTIAAAAAATLTAQGNSRRLSSELMSRTLSSPGPYHAHGYNTSTLSLNRSVSPTPADLRGRRASFSANVDIPLGGFGSMLDFDDPSLPEAPSYDPPNYEHVYSSPSRSERSSTEGSRTDVVVPDSESTRTTATNEDVSVPVTNSSPSPSGNVENATVSPSTPVTEQAEPKAVLMQLGNYVIPFSIRIPSNTVMSLPGSFSDPVGTVSYQVQAVMKQILSSPDHYSPKAVVVEPTFTSATQTIKLIPMNDPTYMPLYSIPFETEAIRANVGHWVWSTGFMEAHAWVPKQGYRPGRVVPLVIHIVNHSDARQIVVETTLCKCLHYGSGLSEIRAMGIAGQGYLMDPTQVTSATTTTAELTSDDMYTTVTEQSTDGRHNRESRRSGRRRSSNHHGSSRQQDTAMPSPPASPYGTSFPTTPTSEQGGDSPEGSIHSSQMASPNSMASISSQLESIHSNSSDSSSAHTNSGNISYSLDQPSSAPAPQAPLPIVQHQRKKVSKSRTLINCNLAVDREIQKTIQVPIPYTTGYSILNAPLLEVSYEIVIKIRAEKEEDELLANVGMTSPSMIARDLGLAFSGDEYDLGDQGECPPYEATATFSSRRRSRRR